MVGCGSCSARQANRLVNGTKFVWQSEDGMDERTYDTEVEAKMKVSRQRGTYKPVDQVAP